MKTSNNNSRELRANAFTLIELLVVVAIIGILVSLAFPVISHVRTTAKKAAAHADMKSLETAVEQYHAEYRRMPFAGEFHGSPPPSVYVEDRNWRGMTEQVIQERFAVPGGWWHLDASAYTETDSGRLAICSIATLQGSNEFEGNPTGFNPRETQFLQIQEGRPLGHFMDPWSKGFDLTADPGNRLYSLIFNQNLNQKIEVMEIARVISGSLVTGKRLVVQCYGPNRKCEIKITDADYDDLYNLNIDNILKHHRIQH